MTEHYTRPDVKAFLAFLNSVPGPKMHEISPAEARAQYVAMVPLGESDPHDLAVIRDMRCPGPGGEIPLRLYDARESRAPGPAVMFFHGGGWVIGDLATHHALCSDIAAALDLPVIAVDYRLAPEHAFPAAHDDCEAAARWVAGNPAELGREITGLITMGDSAGGNMAIAVAEALRDTPAGVPVILQVPLYPATDEKLDHPSYSDFAEGHLLTRDSMDWFHAAYGAKSGDKRAYPMHGAHETAPPTVLVTASLDPIRDQGRAYAKALIDAGRNVSFMEMRGSIHGFTTLRKAIPSAQDDMAAIYGAIRLMLERKGG